MTAEGVACAVKADSVGDDNSEVSWRWPSGRALSRYSRAMWAPRTERGPTLQHLQSVASTDVGSATMAKGEKTSCRDVNRLTTQHSHHTSDD